MVLISISFFSDEQIYRYGLGSKKDAVLVQYAFPSCRKEDWNIILKKDKNPEVLKYTRVQEVASTKKELPDFSSNPVSQARIRNTKN